MSVCVCFLLGIALNLACVTEFLKRDMPHESLTNAA